MSASPTPKKKKPAQETESTKGGNVNQANAGTTPGVDSTPNIKKTKLLLALKEEVVKLKVKQEAEKIEREKIADWIAKTLRPNLQKLNSHLSEQIVALRDALVREEANRERITEWIRQNIGPNLEQVDGLISKKIEAERAQEDAKRKREDEAKEQNIRKLMESMLKKERDRWDEEAREREEVIISRNDVERYVEMRLKEARREWELEKEQGLEVLRRKMGEEMRREIELLKRENEIRTRELIVSLQGTASSSSLSKEKEALPAAAAVVEFSKGEEVRKWLKENGYSDYEQAFVSNGYDSIDIVKSIEGKEDLEAIGVTLPGHQKGLVAAISKLRRGNDPIVSPEISKKLEAEKKADEQKSKEEQMRWESERERERKWIERKEREKKEREERRKREEAEEERERKEREERRKKEEEEDKRRQERRLKEEEEIKQRRIEFEREERERRRRLEEEENQRRRDAQERREMEERERRRKAEEDERMRREREAKNTAAAASPKGPVGVRGGGGGLPVPAAAQPQVEPQKAVGEPAKPPQQPKQQPPQQPRPEVKSEVKNVPVASAPAGEAAVSSPAAESAPATKKVKNTVGRMTKDRFSFLAGEAEVLNQVVEEQPALVASPTPAPKVSAPAEKPTQPTSKAPPAKAPAPAEKPTQPTSKAPPAKAPTPAEKPTQPTVTTAPAPSTADAATNEPPPKKVKNTVGRMTKDRFSFLAGEAEVLNQVVEEQPAFVEKAVAAPAKAPAQSKSVEEANQTNAAQISVAPFSGGDLFAEVTDPLLGGDEASKPEKGILKKSGGGSKIKSVRFSDGKAASESGDYSVDEEIEKLIPICRRIAKDRGFLLFGEIFYDNEAAGTFESLVGTLKAAKKRGILVFETEILLQGAHDKVVIALNPAVFGKQ